MTQISNPRQRFYVTYLIGALALFPAAWLLVLTLQVLIGRVSTAAFTQFWGAHLVLAVVVGLATFWWVARDPRGMARTAGRGALAVFALVFLLSGIIGGVMIGLDQMRAQELASSLIDLIAMILAGALAGGALSLIANRIAESERASRTRR